VVRVTLCDALANLAKSADVDRERISAAYGKRRRHHAALAAGRGVARALIR
jgi:hypothetical protein